MADEKKMPQTDEVGGAAQPSADINEKLKAAVGNINRHNADSKQRESAIVRESRERAREESARSREAEKRNSDIEREAMLNAAAELSAFEEERKLRKRLEREKRRKMEEERRRLAEEKQARDEQRAREIALALEKERAETEARIARSAELLGKYARVEDKKEEVPVPEAVEGVDIAPVAEEVAEVAPEAAEEPVITEEVPEPVLEPEAVAEPVPEVAEPVSEPIVPENKEEKKEEKKEESVPKADLAVSAWGDEGKFVLTLGDKAPEKKQGDFLITIEAEEKKTEPMPVSAKPVAQPTVKVSESAPAPAPEKAPAPQKAPDTRIKLEAPRLASTDMFEVVELEEEEEVEEIGRIPIDLYEYEARDGEKVVLPPKTEDEIPPLEFADDLITSIKKQGKAVHDKKSYKKYLKRSERAINSFYSDIARIDKNIDNLDDENKLPPMIVDSVTIMGKIVEIRADNLSNTARTQKKKKVDKMRDALAQDIDNYNSRAAYFAKVTGQQLTRLSAFLPDAVANGTGKPVIPVLSYTENYVEIFPDADGNLPKADDNVSTIVIAPIVSFEDEIGNIEPKNRDEAKDFLKRVNKSKKKLLSKISDTAKAIEKNFRARRDNLEKEEGAFTAREQDIAESLEFFTRKERRGKKYKKLRVAIDDRYRKVIIEAREEREAKRYDDRDKCLFVERLTAERERVVFTLEAVRALRGIITPKELKAIASSAIREMQTYNALAKECGERIGKELSTVSGALADEVMRSGEGYVFPMIVKRRELCERVGKNERIVGDRVLDDYLKTTKAERIKKIKERFNFDGDKSVSDKALLREDIRLRAIERLAASVNDKKSFKKLKKKCRYSFKEFERTLKQTDKAIFRTRDKDGVIAAITENLRVRGKFIAALAVALECAVEFNRKKQVKKYTALLDTQVERYNQRCADYRTISQNKNNDKGYKLTQISAFLPENIAEGAVGAIIPELSYREHYIECYPLTKEADNAYADPAKRGTGYNPIDYNDRRYTENDMVEITVINPPISAADSMRSDVRAEGRGGCRRANGECFFLLYGARGLNYYLKRAKRHKKLALREEKKFDKKLSKLIKSYEKKTRKLNDNTPELLRDNPKYVKKLSRVEAKYHKKSIKLRYKRVKRGIERRVLNYSVRELAIFREFISAYSLRLKRVRTSGVKSQIDKARDALTNAIRKHNRMTDELSLILGKPIARISTNVAEQIVRDGVVFKLPKIALCRETVESVGDKSRTIGDKYRFGMPYTINSQGIPVYTGTCRIAPGVGIKGIGVDADMRPLIGATNSGIAFAGTPNPKVLGLALSTPTALVPGMSGANSPVFGIAEELSEAEDALFSDIDEKPVSEEIKEIDNYLVGAISARANAVSSVFDYRHYKRRSARVGKAVFSVFKKNDKTYRKYKKLCDRFALKRGVDRLYEGVPEMDAVTLHAKHQRKELNAIRAKAFKSIEQRNGYRQLMLVFELRTLAALGKYIEIKCADLRAASKLELTAGGRFKLWLLGFGRNPKKRCKRALACEIERYNDTHAYRAESIIGKENSYDLTLINTMLPDGLARREVTEDIPTLIYRDRYAEVVTKALDEEAAKRANAKDDEVRYLLRKATTAYGARASVIAGTYIKETARSDDEGGKKLKAKEPEVKGDKKLKAKEPEVNPANAEIVPVLPALRRESYFKAEKKFTAALTPKGGTTKKLVNKLLGKLDKLESKLDKLVESKIRDAENYGEKQEKFTKKKLFALHRYEKAVFRISRITSDCAKYQRKMSRRLRAFRKRLYKLRMKEISFSVVGGKIKSRENLRIPNMNYAELRRRSAVEALILERRRLLLSVALCKCAFEGDYRGRAAMLSRVRRAVTAAMIHYNGVVDECERILKTKKLWRADMVWYKHVQTGKFDTAISETPRLAFLRQLAESFRDEVKPIIK